MVHVVAGQRLFFMSSTSRVHFAGARPRMNRGVFVGNNPAQPRCPRPSDAGGGECFGPYTTFAVRLNEHPSSFYPCIDTAMLLSEHPSSLPTLASISLTGGRVAAPRGRLQGRDQAGEAEPGEGFRRGRQALRLGVQRDRNDGRLRSAVGARGGSPHALQRDQGRQVFASHAFFSLNSEFSLFMNGSAARGAFRPKCGLFIERKLIASAIFFCRLERSSQHPLQAAPPFSPGSRICLTLLRDPSASFLDSSKLPRRPALGILRPGRRQQPGALPWFRLRREMNAHANLCRAKITNIPPLLLSLSNMEIQNQNWKQRTWTLPLQGATSTTCARSTCGCGGWPTPAACSWGTAWTTTSGCATSPCPLPR